MGLRALQKLEKLTIIGYTNGDNDVFSGDPKTYKAMFNPNKFSLTFGQDISSLSTTGNLTTSGTQSTTRENGTLNIDLFVDGTGASRSGGIEGAAGIVGAIEAALDTFVSENIKKFYETTMMSADKTHKPRFLKVMWGKGLLFACKLQSATVSYSLFNRNGTPLRATINANFKQTACTEIDASGFSQNGLHFQSPDITKLYTVVAGDTIYNIAKKEYDSESFYQKIAEVNDLKNYRKLIPGTQLILPPVNNA